MQTETDLRAVRVCMCASDSWRSKARALMFKYGENCLKLHLESGSNPSSAADEEGF